MRRLAVLAAALVLVGAAVLVARLLLDPGRGYSKSYGNGVVHYELDSDLLARRLHEVAVVPQGNGSRGLLMLLHGRHDPGPLSWLVGSRTGPESLLGDALLQAVARLGPRAPVVVLLDGGAHSYYHDRRDGKWGAMILREAIPDATRRFHTAPGRLAIGGISMGGYGAFHLASLRPSSFCAVGGHSAALWTSGGASAPGAFDDAADYDANDVFAAARQGRYDGLELWLDGGSDDPFRAADDEFARLLHGRGAALSDHVWPGGHTASYWHEHMAEYLAFYAHALRSCRIVSGG